jgi:hypothetical protein
VLDEHCIIGNWGSGNPAFTIRTGVAGQLGYMPSPSPAFPACYFPLWVSPPSRLGVLSASEHAYDNLPGPILIDERIVTDVAASVSKGEADTAGPCGIVDIGHHAGGQCIGGPKASKLRFRLLTLPTTGELTIGEWEISTLQCTAEDEKRERRRGANLFTLELPGATLVDQPVFCCFV